MGDTSFFILSLSIVFAAVGGMVRYRAMDPAYHPFVYYACLSVAVEIIAYIFISCGQTEWVGTLYNLFAIGEFYMLTRMFHNWGLFRRKQSTFIGIVVLSVLLYLCTLYIRGYGKINYFARIVNAFLLIFFSISAFNRMILNERINIFKNAKFWICIGMMIYFTYFILVSTEQLSFLHINRTYSFKNKVFQINAYSNLLVNLLYAVAVIWIPRKKNIITL